MEYLSRSVSYFRNFIFGVEDSLVSTVGLLSGIALAETPRSTILTTGVVLIFVEAFSMGAGSFLSEYSVDEYTNKSEKTGKKERISSVIMFFSYFISGFIPLSSYMFFPVTTAFYSSIIFSLVALFILGIIGARICRINVIKNAFRMVLVGGSAIVVGSLAGMLV